MSKSNKKPRPKLNPRSFEPTVESQKKEEKDWGFDEIARSKRRGH